MDLCEDKAAHDSLQGWLCNDMAVDDSIPAECAPRLSGYMAVVAQQQFNGSWKLSQQLADIIGKSLPDLKQAAAGKVR